MARGKRIDGWDLDQRGLISLEGVSKQFRKRTLKKRHYTTLKSQLLQFFSSKSGKEEAVIRAVEPLDLRLEPGTSVGVIGRNGSGKSTLLKLISGIYQPDAGVVRVAGRVSALIELGAGFHPDFTGRENLYLGGAMYGLNRAYIDERFDQIVRYAELDDFIDDPVRTYSSGMYMRLGFSLAVHTDPDILLIDEVLAVGDAAFIHRCHDTLSEFRRKNKTLVLVTHDLSSVERWCDEAVWLHKGRVAKRGEPRMVIDAYMQAIEVEEERFLEAENEELKGATKLHDAAAADTPREETAGAAALDIAGESDSGRWGNREVEITDVRMRAADGSAQWLFHSGEPAVIEIDFQVHQAVEELVCGVGILRADGLSVHGTNTDIERIETPFSEQPIQAGLYGTICYHLESLALLDNSYFLDVAVHRSDGTPYDYHHRLYKFSVRNPIPYHGVFCPKHHWEFRLAEHRSEVSQA